MRGIGRVLIVGTVLTVIVATILSCGGTKVVNTSNTTAYNSENGSPIFKRASEFYAEGQIDSVIVVIREHLRRNGRDPEAYTLIPLVTEAYIRKGDYAQAHRLIDLYRDKFPKSSFLPRLTHLKDSIANTNVKTSTMPPLPPTTTTPATAPKPKAAVYIVGNPQGRDALRMAVNTFLVKSGKYQMIAVDAIDVVAQEHKRQMSGSVSDEQIARLGYDAGAQYVCVVERTELDGVSYVATRMVSVESKVAEFADMVKLPQGGDIIEFIKWQVGSMLGMDVGQRPTSAPQIPSAPVSNSSSAQQPVNQVAVPTNQPSGVDGSDILTDGRDGKRYRTVVIGGKRWMAENLNYKPKPGESWCYDNDNSNCVKYGRLYSQYTARTVCPAGYHLPSDQEWDDLVEAAGGYGVAGKKLKSKSGWNNYGFYGNNGNGTDDFGFSALPGGLNYTMNNFQQIGDSGLWWTGDRCKEWGMGSGGNGVSRTCIEPGYGFSVRCVADN